MSVFYPLQFIEDFQDYWWLIALLTVLGGGLGGILQVSRPALYEAEAVLGFRIDYMQTGDLDLLEEDRVILAASEVLQSIPIAEQVVADALALGIVVDLPSLWDRMHLERRQARWSLRVRHTDPQAAAVLAELWARHGSEALTIAHEHALQAQSLQAQLEVLQGCLAAPPLEDGLATENLCALASLEALSEAIQEVNHELEMELIASHGLLPSLMISQPGPVSIPTEAIQFDRSTLVLAGALIGFLLGIVTTHIRVSERPIGELRHG